METTDTLSLLNVFEVETDEGMRTLIGYVDPVRAGAEGISTRSIVGGFIPGADGGFDLATFNANPEFAQGSLVIAATAVSVPVPVIGFP